MQKRLLVRPNIPPRSSGKIKSAKQRYIRAGSSSYEMLAVRRLPGQPSGPAKATSPRPGAAPARRQPDLAYPVRLDECLAQAMAKTGRPARSATQLFWLAREVYQDSLANPGPPTRPHVQPVRHIRLTRRVRPAHRRRMFLQHQTQTLTSTRRHVRPSWPNCR